MAVVTYWRLPEEDDKFLTYLEKSEDIIACIDEWVIDPKELDPLSIRELIQMNDPAELLFGPREFMEMTPITSMEKDGRRVFGRYYGDGPVIAYSRGVWRGPGRLGKSNLVFNPTRGVPNSTVKIPQPPEFLAWEPGATIFVPQPPAFIRWGRRVMQWMRRHTQPHGYYRVTPRVAAEVENGLELVH